VQSVKGLPSKPAANFVAIGTVDTSTEHFKGAFVAGTFDATGTFTQKS
jgi:hypothetical protein